MESSSDRSIWPSCKVNVIVICQTAKYLRFERTHVKNSSNELTIGWAMRRIPITTTSQGQDYSEVVTTKCQC